jgi:hypothetical protein
MNKKKRKNIRHKRAIGVFQVVECLPSKHEALSSNPITAKSIKNKKICLVANFKTKRMW